MRIILLAVAFYLAFSNPAYAYTSIWQPPSYGDEETETETHTVTPEPVRETVIVTQAPEPAPPPPPPPPPAPVQEVVRVTETVTSTSVAPPPPTTPRVVITSEAPAPPPVVPADAPPPKPAECKPAGLSVRGDEGPGPIPMDDLLHAHQFATGAGVRVAIIDTGIAPHPRIAGRLENIGAESGDCDGHGTVVAGIIGASHGGGYGGIAPNAQLLNVPDHGGTLDSLAGAITRAVDAGADVINISIVGCFDPASPANTDAVDKALLYAERRNAIVIGAAGNVGGSCPAGSVVYPAHAPTVLGVGAVDNGYAVAGYSVADPSRSGVNAPGTMNMGLAATGDGFIRALAPDRPLIGTSFAAPIIAGAAALLRERYPLESAFEIRNRIIHAREGSSNTISIGRVMSATPYDPHYRLEAVSYARPEEKPAPRRAVLAGAGVIVVLVVLVPLVYRASRRLDTEVATGG
ncbi:MAG: S8 family serine peptidase [Corynebacterium sp.]|nr:S8 family serine peptidase [Corynebacterium sp.]